MLKSKLFRMINTTVAALALVAVIGANGGPVALADSTPVTVPYLAGVNTTTNLYDAPNLGADYVGQVVAGQTWFVLGTDSTGAWTEIEVTPTIFGWGVTSAFALNGLTLPVIAGFTGGSTVATPVPAAITSSGPVVIAVGSSALVGVNTTSNVYNLPNGDVVGQVLAGQTWFVVGRDSTGKWTEIQIDPATFGWVQTSALGIGSIQLPVVPGVTGS